MKTFIHKLLWGCLLLLISASGFSQDIHFSQFFETPLLRNPALAGIFNGDLRIQAVYKTQWGSVTVPYQTGSFNGEYKLQVGRGNDFLTIGGEILYDKAGTVALTSTHILPVANFHKSLSSERNMYLSVGFMGGIVQRKLDQSKITTNNEFNGIGFDPSLGNGETFANSAYTYMDGSAGVSLNSSIGESDENNFFIGAAYHHFNKAPKVSFYGDKNIEMIPKIVFSAGLKLAVTDYSSVTFQGDYSKQGNSTEMIGGMMYSYKLDDILDPRYILHAGALIRWKDAIIPVVKLETRPLAFAVSYDVNVSQLKSASTGRGGFELSITYQTSFSRANEEVRCPRF